MCISTLNTGQLNPLFHTFAEFRLIVNRIVARQSTDWLAANVKFSPNVKAVGKTVDRNLEEQELNFNSSLTNSKSNCGLQYPLIGYVKIVMCIHLEILLLISRQ